MAQSPIGTCEICVQAPGSQYCKQCRQYFCNNCKTAHLRSKMARNHVFGKKNEIGQEEEFYCRHVNRQMFMCKDCDFPLCKACLVENHNGHSVEDLDKIFSSLHDQASTKMKGIVNDFKRKSSGMKSMTTSYEKESEKLERAISKQGELIKSSVDKMVSAIIENVRKSRGNVKKHYPTCVDDAISTTCKKWQQQLDEIGQKKATGSSVFKIQKLLDDMKTMELPNLPDVPTVTYCSKPVDEKIIKDLLGGVKFLSFSKPNPTSKGLFLVPEASGYGLRFVGGKDVNEDVYVSYVSSDGPAAKAGLKQFDRIIAVDGKQTKGLTHDEVTSIFRNAKGKDNVSITIEPFQQ
ncbi:unnamed protein product [Mytilus coruscus]|uniref:PDZ domain-containing protein n=1 Tax=Mytilus coruscus TaxID=42192 RepID=A0A6J8A6C1_MYTCO|nr:unnamed protein product [Mytilus coruscus]